MALHEGGGHSSNFGAGLDLGKPMEEFSALALFSLDSNEEGAGDAEGRPCGKRRDGVIIEGRPNEHGYVDGGPLILEGDGTRSVWNHFWQAEYNRLLCDFFLRAQRGRVPPDGPSSDVNSGERCFTDTMRIGILHGVDGIYRAPLKREGDSDGKRQQRQA